MYFHLYQDGRQEWRWTLYAGNNHKIANSGEGYRHKTDAVAAIGLVQGTNDNTPVKE
ncbi:YegP family protein [Bradyrhizobium sp. USDA 3315]